MMTVPTVQTHNNLSNFPIVGIAIGVSTEEIDVVKKIVSDITNDSGMTYIIIQELLFDFSNNLPEILSQYSKIPVLEIINDIHLEPNHIYIMPEKNLLQPFRGSLKLKHITRVERQNDNIEVFFESLAEVYRSEVIGIVLCAHNRFHGARGFKKIKEVGGISIIQKPKKEIFNGIPQTIIDIYDADYVLDPKNIFSELIRIKKIYTRNCCYSDETSWPENDEKTFIKIIDLISVKKETNFESYKQSILRRRLTKRMVTLQKDTLENYYSFLQNNSKEQEILFNDFLIKVTCFFRNPECFTSLNKIIFPSLIQKITNNVVRIWVVGCSTGEEAYSLAIAIHEYLAETNNTHIKVQIFASDLSERNVLKARTGIYSHFDIQNISPERLNKYFVKRNGQFHVNKVLGNMCIFAVHNFINNPPFSKIDLISCRNVLIYFNSFLQKKAFTTFHFSLNDRGILFLGQAELSRPTQNLFDNIAVQEKLYVRKNQCSAKYTQENNKPANETVGHLSVISKNTSQATIRQKSDKEEFQTLNDGYNRLSKEFESVKEELIHVNYELKQNQKQLTNEMNFSDLIFNTFHTPILIMDRHFFIKSANPAFYKYFNITENETEGHHLFNIGNSQWNISEFKYQINVVFHDKMIVENFKIEMSCSDVEKKIMLINARPVENTNEELVLLTLNDITDLVNVNKMLVLKKREMQELNSQLELFTFSASRDLYEPLRKVLMFCQRIFITEKNISESGKHDLERVERLIINTSQLLNDIVNYSRVNFLDKKYKKTNLNSVIKKSIRDLKDIVNEKNAVIVVGNFPILNIISNQIQQLFTTLISNSIKYSIEGVPPEIKIETQQIFNEEIIEMGGNPETEYLKIAVIDNGIGFEKGYESRIFEPFYRLHTDKYDKGSGLGLTLAKKIVANHRGFIKGMSEKNHGTTMIIYIPL